MKLLLFVLGSVLAIENATAPTSNSAELSQTTTAATTGGVPKAQNFTSEANAPSVEPPKVLYATPAILAVYGINESIETEAPVSLSESEVKQIADTLRKLAASNPNQTVSEFAKSVWKNLKDKRQVDYSKWYFAHTLNVYIAVEAVIPVARAVSEDAFRVLMGHCTCNGSPVFHKLIAFCSENTSCFVDADHARYASRALEKSAAALRFWPIFIAGATKGDIPLTYAKWYMDEAAHSLRHAVQINPELATVINGYAQLVVKANLPTEAKIVEEPKSGEKEHSKNRHR